MVILPTKKFFSKWYLRNKLIETVVDVINNKLSARICVKRDGFKNLQAVGEHFYQLL